MVPRRPAPNSGRRGGGPGGGGRNGGGGERGMRLRIVEHSDAEGTRSPRGGGVYGAQQLQGTGGGRQVRNDKGMATGSHVADFLRDRNARQMQNKILMNLY